MGTAITDNSFKPLYDDSYKVDKRPQKIGVASAVTIQPLKNSEASLAIGMPVNGVKQVPGKVMDASLDNITPVRFPKPEGTKVVFPEDKKPVQSNVIPQRAEPPRSSQPLDNKVLHLSSKPNYPVI